MKQRARYFPIKRTVISALASGTTMAFAIAFFAAYSASAQDISRNRSTVVASIAAGARINRSYTPIPRFNEPRLADATCSDGSTCAAPYNYCCEIKGVETCVQSLSDCHD